MENSSWFTVGADGIPRLTGEFSNALDRYIHEHKNDPVRSRVSFQTRLTNRNSSEPVLSYLSLHQESQLDILLNSDRETWSSRLLKLIDKKGFKKDSDFYNKAGFSRQLFSRMKKSDYKPNKTTVIKAGIVLRLTIVEMEEFLELAGYSLFSGSDEDLIIRFCLEQGCYDVDAISCALYERGFDALVGT